MRSVLFVDRPHILFVKGCESMEDAWKRAEHAAGFLWGPVAQAVCAISRVELARVEEIRLRINKPLSVLYGGTIRYVCENGALSKTPAEGMKVTAAHLEECFRKLCSYAVHTHEEEIAQGFVSVQGGHRAGLAGTGFQRANGSYGLRDITSINLRVARQVKGCADQLVPLVQNSEGDGLLLAGPPGSGKTTLLRDLARQLSCQGKKIAVVDERGEISGVFGTSIENDLGANCDVIAGMEKSRGILMAVRCLSPQIILCDELGTAEEITAIGAGLSSGVTVVTSIHAGSFDQLKQKPQFGPLVRSGAFRWVVLLSTPEKPFMIREVSQL